jgi:hypothetical protein
MYITLEELIRLQPLKATTKPTSITPCASSNLVKLEKDLIYLKVMLKFSWGGETDEISCGRA